MSTHSISAALRQRVAAAARFRCGYCLTSQQIIGPLLEIDHIVPEAKGGTNDEENLFLACPLCNSYKAAHQEAPHLTSLEFLDQIQAQGTTVFCPVLVST